MAMVCQKENKPDSAIMCYQKVLQINPESMTAFFKIADLYFEKGDMGKAIHMNEDIIKKYPELDIPYFNIGYYFILHGDTTEAIKYFENAAQRNPSYESCTNLSLIYKARGDIQRSEYYHGLAQEAEQRRNERANPGR
jgi:tetratricopeptide (TPR) repeat protein